MKDCKNQIKKIQNLKDSIKTTTKMGYYQPKGDNFSYLSQNN